MVRRYQKSGSTGSALVRMPTGTGKTGVMAVLSQCFADTANVLIVAPWAQLTGQLKREINIRFWEKLGARTRRVKEIAHTFRPSTLSAVLNDAPAGPAVFICTNQTLERLHSEGGAGYRSLQSRLSLVLVDEGHREPAPAWAQAIRELAKPTVLFSATPYRNDHRLFNIDKDFIYRLPHHQAVNDRFIREVQFIEKDWGESAKSFVNALLDFYQNEFKPGETVAAHADRVIVRCATDDAVKEVAHLLKRRGHRVVAVHDRFHTEEDESRWRKVPDPEENDASFWVHQFKLIEGVDDPRFSLLAIYQPLGNARALVQQVGRIIRNPGRKRNQFAYVLCNRRHKQQATWDAYLRYEARLAGDTEEVGPATIIHDLNQLQEDYQYLDGNFRQKFDPTAIDFYRHLNFRLSANVYKPGKNFAFAQLLHAMREAIDIKDYFLCGESSPDKDTHVLVYTQCYASPLLINQTFMELGLGYSIVRRSGGYIFYYDTEGLIPVYLLERCMRVEPAELERVLSGEKVRISQVSLLNSDLGFYSVRRRSLSARSIAQISPGLADHAHFCSTAEGVIENDLGEAIRRYVGFTRARVSQPSSGKIEYEDFINWVDSVAGIIQQNEAQPTDLFGRYALYVASPEDPVPENILFDIDDVAEEYSVLSDSEAEDGQTILLDDRCWDVSDSRFSCIVGDKQCEASLCFDREGRRFEITSGDLENLFVRRGVAGERRRNLVAHLNLTQSFRIVTDDGLIYAHGQFYKPRVPLWGRKISDRIDLLQILFPRETLEQLASEKGRSVAGGGNGWEVGSVFEYIDRQSADGLLASDNLIPDILVCDDLGNELADFIAVQFAPPRIALIHAKSGSGQNKLSASAFHEVCGQAVKNLGILTPQWNSLPKNLDIWNRPWKMSGIGSVNRRIRVAPQGMTAAKLWEKMEQTIRHPAAVREVWIVMGNGMSYAAFDQERKKNKPRGSIIQMIYLLQSTWSAVSSIGAFLKVFCQR